MYSKKTPEEIAILREGGRRAATLLHELCEMVGPGVTTEDLNDAALSRMETLELEPVLLGYHPDFAPRPYPAAICTSVNDEVVHGVPNEGVRTLTDGDIITVDVTVGYKGLIVDTAYTVAVKTPSTDAQKLINVTKEALAVAIAAAKPGAYTGDVGAAVERFVTPHGYGIVEALCGHGVGYAVHEEPPVPNFGTAGTGVELVAGMVLAIEPMLTAGGKEVEFDTENGYTVRTGDSSLSAHFEHTVAITEDGAEVLTQR